jgi:hypothetical protein
MVSNVFGNHGFSQTLRSNENDVFGSSDEVQREGALDGVARDFLGPVPIEVGDGFESTELAASGPTFETSSGAVLLLKFGDAFEELARGKALLSGMGKQVIELV